MSDEAKVRFLFDKTQHQALQQTIAALKAGMLTGDPLPFTTCANHLSTAVSELPEYITLARNVSGITREAPSVNSPGIYHNDGTIKTGHISNWRSLSNEDRNIVAAERLRLGLGKAKTTGKRGKGTGAHLASKSSNANKMKQLTDTNTKMRRQIKALKRTSGGGKEDEDSEESNPEPGDSFGGKNSKKAKKGT